MLKDIKDLLSKHWIPVGIVLLIVMGPTVVMLIEYKEAHLLERVAIGLVMFLLASASCVLGIFDYQKSSNEKTPRN